MKKELAPLIKYRNYYGIFFMLYAIFFAGMLFKYTKLEQNALNFLLVYIGIPLLILFLHLLIEKLTMRRRRV